MDEGNISALNWSRVRFLMRGPLPPSFNRFLGHKLLSFILTLQGLGAFALITLVVILKKFHVARPVMLPLIRREISRRLSRSARLTILVGPELPPGRAISASTGPISVSSLMPPAKRFASFALSGNSMPVIAAWSIQTQSGQSKSIALTGARAGNRGLER